MSDDHIFLRELEDIVTPMRLRFSAEVLDKARTLLAEDLVEQDATYSDVWWVAGSDPAREYRVQLGAGFITCTCPHGLMVGAGETRCSHAAAVLMMIDTQQREESDGSGTTRTD